MFSMAQQYQTLKVPGMAQKYSYYQTKVDLVLALFGRLTLELSRLRCSCNAVVLIAVLTWSSATRGIITGRRVYTISFREFRGEKVMTAELRTWYIINILLTCY